MLLVNKQLPIIVVVSVDTYSPNILGTKDGYARLTIHVQQILQDNIGHTMDSFTISLQLITNCL